MGNRGSSPIAVGKVNKSVRGRGEGGVGGEAKGCP